MSCYTLLRLGCRRISRSSSYSYPSNRHRFKKLSSSFSYFSTHAASEERFSSCTPLLDNFTPNKVSRIKRKSHVQDNVLDEAPGNILTDRFGRQHTYLRISLTEKCNLRCKYCMPKEGVVLSPKENMMTHDEIVRLARIFASQGVNKIRLTGGEPLLFRGIEKLVGDLKSIPGIKELGITTNGMLLKRKLPALITAGIDALNVMEGLDRVLQAVDAAVNLGVPSVKINCVVMNGMNEEELLDFVSLTELRPVEVRFIEYMPFQANAWNNKKLVKYTDMITTINHGLQKIPQLVRLENDLGFITSMTQHFCGDCNRLRLTADGNLKTCLFGTDETSLMTRMRKGETNEEILPTIKAAVLRKKAVLGGHNDMNTLANHSDKNRPMIHIGG
eukprot:GSMAST32.ASY1.ANO1.40.1 assembled CDS